MHAEAPIKSFIRSKILGTLMRTEPSGIDLTVGDFKSACVMEQTIDWEVYNDPQQHFAPI